MKIEQIRTCTVGNPWKNWVIVLVETDEGISGIGEATSLTARSAAASVDDAARFAIGMDPREPRRVFEAIHKGLFLKMTPGTCGIEIACWDILGKSMGVPLWRLFGGRARDRLRVYANGWYQCPRDPRAFAECAAAVKERGYTALKFDPFGTAHQTLDRSEERLSTAIVRAVRDEVGEETDILIEGHDRFCLSTAIRVGRALEEFRPMWFETPVMSRDIRATLEVARAIKVPVASGERFDTLTQFAELLAPRAVDIVQPEPLKCGGIQGALAVASLARAHGAQVACHQAQSPLNTAINAHLQAAMSNFLIQECFDDFLEPWAHDVFVGVPRVADGHLRPSDAPGIGVALVESEAAKHPPCADRVIRLFQAGWERRGR